jgi:3-ketosteroid 9alpha-monooxygenase subunit A
MRSSPPSLQVVLENPAAPPNAPLVSARFPFPPFPAGWFQVAWSDELAPSAVVPLSYLGRDLVLFRGADGAARVLDAHCPHLGAHLGHGGRVEGGRLVCPFHGWCFDGDGACVAIPQASKIPPGARVGSWPVREQSGRVMVWHHPAGAPPAWELPALPELEGEWTPEERRRWVVRSCLQEMAENAVDSAHFRHLHGMGGPTTRLELDGPVMRVHSDAGMHTPRGGVATTVVSTAYGLGFGTVRFRGIVDTFLVSSATPLDEERIELRFGFRVRRLTDEDTTRGVGKAFVREVARQLEQDIPIWENKIYRDPPLLCEADGPIGAFRRWCKQFY